jgi:hypothetical protein
VEAIVGIAQGLTLILHRLEAKEKDMLLQLVHKLKDGDNAGWNPVLDKCIFPQFYIPNSP